REPLVPTGHALVDAPGRADGAPWVRVNPARRLPDDATVARLAEAVRTTERGVVVAGWGADVAPATVARLADAAGWPGLAEPLSNVRCGARAVSTYDALLRDARFATAHRPQAALRLGAPVTSKATVRWLDGGVRQWMIDPDGTWLDPNRVVAEIA